MKDAAVEATGKVESSLTEDDSSNIKAVEAPTPVEAIPVEATPVETSSVETPAVESPPVELEKASPWVDVGDEDDKTSEELNSSEREDKLAQKSSQVINSDDEEEESVDIESSEVKDESTVIENEVTQESTKLELDEEQEESKEIQELTEAIDNVYFSTPEKNTEGYESDGIPSGIFTPSEDENENNELGDNENELVDNENEPTSPSRLTSNVVSPQKIKETKKSVALSTARSRTARSNSIRHEVPVYPSGRTLAESTHYYEQQFRSASVKTHTNNSTPLRRRSQTSSGKSCQNNNQCNKQEIDFMAQVMKSSKKSDTEGRPSIGTITQQWEFMKNHFANNSDEEVTWMMVSKKPGAYEYANKMKNSAEDKLYKATYEIDFYQNKLNHFSGMNAKLPNYVKQLHDCYAKIRANPKDEATTQTILTTHANLVQYYKSVDATSLFSAFKPEMEIAVSALVQETDKFKIIRKARDLHESLSKEIFQLQNKLKTATVENEEAINNIDKWTKRETEADDYAVVMKKEEEEFMKREYEDNQIALNTMRSYFPIKNHITELTIAEIQQAYTENGGLISVELAQELKQNKFLHWVVTHKDDITMANFLNGESKAYFENLESYDLVEMRAIASVLPDKFELDGDGRKANWRFRFFTRFKTLVSHYRAEKVKGAWDGVKKCRTMFELPPLKSEQLRRNIYFYRTVEQMDLRIKQFSDRLALLEKKKGLKQKAIEEFDEAKAEYDTILTEMRDPDFISLYGNALAQAKDLAKQAYQDAEKKKKTITQDVDRLQNSIDSAPFNLEQLNKIKDEIKEFLMDRGIDWSVPGTEAELIDGVFIEEREITPRIKAAAKFVDPALAAELRKEELKKLQAIKEESLLSTESSELEEPPSRLSFSSSRRPSISFAAEGIPPLSVITDISEGEVQVEAKPSPLSTESASTTESESSPDDEKPKKKPLISPLFANSLNKILTGMQSPIMMNNNNTLTRSRTPTMIRRASMFNTGGPPPLPRQSFDGKESLNFTFPSRGSFSATKTPLEPVKPEEPPKPVEPKKSKSKFLRLLGFGVDKEKEKEKEKEEKPSPFGRPLGGPFGGAGGPPKMDFLTELKMKRKNNDENSENNSTTPAASEEIKKPVHPLLGARPNPFGGGGGASFLDQIKARRIE